MAGWNDSDRRDRLPSNWASEIVPAVKKRDGGRCTWRLPSGARCPRPGTDVDHRVPGDNHSMRNLQLLCGDHHQKKTALDNRRATQKRKAARYRKPEAHPGMIAPPVR
jgi:5-methylcytosine-specific restriction endonuclease McrA